MTQTIWYPGHEHLRSDIVRGEGNFVYDAGGKRYLDLESGVWAASLGHGHPRILAALAEQAAQITHNGFCYSSPIVEDAARELLTLLGFDGGKCVFLSSGSDAVEYGVRVARMLTDRPLFLTMTDSYFGAYGSAAARRAEEWSDFDWFPCASCEDPKACDAGCERLAEIPFDRIGGFLLEPGSSSGLVRFPPAKLIGEIARRVRDAGGWLIINEVTTGIGRTGAWFGFQHYGIEPDVVATGKGVGAGYPVSATAFSRRAAERLGERPVKYAQSHQNDPLGAAVLREVIRTVREEGLIEHAAEMGALLGGGLEAIRARRPRVRAVRSRGLMAAVDLEDAPDCAFTTRVHRDLVARGFIVGRRPGINVLRIDPCLTIQPGEIESFLAALEETLGPR
jgi:acetylornithine aminotransferase